MALTPAHPLFSLPDDEIIQKLRKTSLVSLEEILKFSLISERCKDLVTTAGIKGDSINVSIGSIVTIKIITSWKALELNFYSEPDMYWGTGAYGRKKKLTVPQSVIVNEYTPDVSDTTRSNRMKNTTTMQYWLKHLQDIFNYPKIDVIWFYENLFEFEIDDIKEVFGAATQVWISNTGCYAFNQMILQNIIPVEKLSIKPANFQNVEIPGRILTQNFDYLDIDSGLEEPTSMTLDELLLIKGGLKSHFFIFDSGIDYTNVNEDDNEVIMKGISHQVIPADQRRRFKPAENGMPQVVEGTPTPTTKRLVTSALIMAASLAHPLLNLPDDLIIQKLREMNLEEILKFSLISERCKVLVTSAGIKGVSFRVSIGNKITITISISTNSKDLQLHYYREPDMYWKVGAYGRRKKLREPQSVLVEAIYWRSYNEDTTSELEETGFTMKNWLEHLQEIFNYPKINYVRFSEGSSQFDIDDIKEVFGKTTEVKIQDTGCHVFNQMILEKFDKVEELQIKTSDFHNSEIPDRVLMRNVGLHIGDYLEETTIMSLDQLLIINSKRLYIEGLQMSAKEFNKFIKLWQRGSTPQLEWLSIHYTGAREDDESVIMGGIEHSVILTNTIRKFKRPRNTEPYLIEGGMDIHRIDGVKATIHFTSLHAPFSCWEMFVWFDHCVAEF